MTTLDGKAAIVTGAGRGIGRAIAQTLASAGASVALAARSASELNETKRLIEQAGGRALAVPTDVSKEPDVARLVQATKAAFGDVHVLVNNAGAAPVGAIEDLSPEAFDEIIATNVRATYLCSRAVWPIMRAAGGGTIVNFSSVAAFDPFPSLGAYGGAKAFVTLYTKALAAEGAPHQIRVIAVAPGAVETRMLRDVVPDYPKEKTLAPQDVAEFVLTLLSPACRHASGQTIVFRKD